MCDDAMEALLAEHKDAPDVLGEMQSLGYSHSDIRRLVLDYRDPG
eukprot:gene7414-6955_t